MSGVHYTKGRPCLEYSPSKTITSWSYSEIFLGSFIGSNWGCLYLISLEWAKEGTGELLLPLEAWSWESKCDRPRLLCSWSEFVVWTLSNSSWIFAFSSIFSCSSRYIRILDWFQVRYSQNTIAFLISKYPILIILSFHGEISVYLMSELNFFL